jgi:sporadic carbohydrate cluster protein (TIGR04323 family)
MDGSYLIHEQVMNDLDDIDGVAAYSVFQLPEHASCRKKIYKQIINQKKTYHFAVEGLNFYDEQGCDRIEMLWQIKKTLPFCYQAI